MLQLFAEREIRERPFRLTFSVKALLRIGCILHCMCTPLCAGTEAPLSPFPPPPASLPENFISNSNFSACTNWRNSHKILFFWLNLNKSPVDVC